MLIAAIFDKVSALIFLLRLFTPFPTTKGQNEKKQNLSKKKVRGLGKRFCIQISRKSTSRVELGLCLVCQLIGDTLG